MLTFEPSFKKSQKQAAFASIYLGWMLLDAPTKINLNR